jgi:hypothetical protein
MATAVRGVLLLAAVLWLAGCCSTPAAAQSGVRSVDQVRASGSLRGTDLDGDWVVGPANSVRPDAALIRRFDHLLTAVGEVDLRELRAWIEREVTQQRDAATASQVLVAWDEHLAWLQGRATPSQEASGSYASNAPMRGVRVAAPAIAPRLLLMPDPPAGNEAQQAIQAQRVERFGAEAAERLRVEDEARWSWARRMAEARTQLQTLKGAAAERYLVRQFSGNELLRARTLLGMPP